MKRDLSKDILDLEIKLAMLNLVAIKAPRGDNLNGIFYHNN